LVNKNGFSIHHVVNSARFHPIAFIFDERRRRMVNRWCAAVAARFSMTPGVNPMLKRTSLKPDE
jgi:hypothetical protein